MDFLGWECMHRNIITLGNISEIVLYYVRQSLGLAREISNRTTYVACAQSALVRGRNLFPVHGDNVRLDLSVIFTHAIDRSNLIIDRNDWRVAIYLPMPIIVSRRKFSGTKTKTTRISFTFEVLDDSFVFLLFFPII